MGQCKKDVTPLLMHWSYVFFALTHRSVAVIKFVKTSRNATRYVARHCWEYLTLAFESSYCTSSTGAPSLNDSPETWQQDRIPGFITKEKKQPPNPHAPPAPPPPPPQKKKKKKKRHLDSSHSNDIKSNMLSRLISISMGYSKKDVTPVH